MAVTSVIDYIHGRIDKMPEAYLMIKSTNVSNRKIVNKVSFGVARCRFVREDLHHFRQVSPLDPES